MCFFFFCFVFRFGGFFFFSFFEETFTLCYRYIHFCRPLITASGYKNEEILVFESTIMYFELIISLINIFVMLYDGKF